MTDPTTIGYEAEPHDVEGLLHLVCGELLDEPDLLVRYNALTSQQVLVDALVSRIKAERGRALAEMHAGGLNLDQVADAAGLGSYQRVQKLISAGRRQADG